jgi:hypothetical protein
LFVNEDTRRLINFIVSGSGLWQQIKQALVMNEVFATIINVALFKNIICKE